MHPCSLDLASQRLSDTCMQAHCLRHMQARFLDAYPSAWISCSEYMAGLAQAAAGGPGRDKHKAQHRGGLCRRPCPA